MAGIRYISVILPLKLEWEPSYSVPEEENIQIGDRVKVLLANREYLGVVSDVDIIPSTEPSKIKRILNLEKELERILPEEIEFWRAVAKYYLCSIGEVYKAAYPLGRVSLEEARARAIKRKDSKKKSSAKTPKGPESTLSPEEEKKEQAEEIKQVKLTAPQSLAYSKIKESFSINKPVLLNGITGSGKTEIYIKLAQEALESHKNVLYLVPEIALSRQLEERLEEYFGNSLMIFHSGETAASKRNTAERIRELRGKDENYIILGTRSSLFLPHHDLGLIVVDEEHDNSYKQDAPAPRYNGRDAALMMHIIHKANIILGSATPSLEEVYNCASGKHVRVELKERYYGSQNSDIEIIDTKAERKKRGMVGNFSRKLIDHINSKLSKGEQIMILRSRRAWASLMQCGACGDIVKCPHCNVSMSLHKNGQSICHYCGHKEVYSGKCKRCGGQINLLGSGTQRIEDEVAVLFPNARIARLDSDSAQNKSTEKKIIKDFKNGEIDILIGTQIVSKGFDFSNLTLVAVISADALIGLQDFRADEKAMHLLEQFRGRCGRRDKKGLLIIQTSQPEHPVYQRIGNNELEDFNANLLNERREFNFPPFTRIIEISIKDSFEDRAERMATALAGALRARFEPQGCSILQSPITGPYSPAIDKISDNYIRAIRISLKKDMKLAQEKEIIKKTVTQFEQSRKYNGHITINVDPS